MQPKYLSISQDDNRNKSYNDSQAKMCFMFTVKTAQWKKIDKITLDKKISSEKKLQKKHSKHSSTSFNCDFCGC